MFEHIYFLWYVNNWQVILGWFLLSKILCTQNKFVNWESGTTIQALIKYIFCCLLAINCYECVSDGNDDLLFTKTETEMGEGKWWDR